MSGMDQANLWRSLGVLLLVVMALAPRIRGIGATKTVQMVLAWAAIFGALILLVSSWPQIRAAIDPASPVAVGNEMRFAARDDGHFYVRASVNGKSVLFMVDTGASEIVLTRETATRLGFNPDGLRYDGFADTANGMVRTSGVRLRSIDVGTIHRENMRATVNAGDLGVNLLGMRYLSALSSWRVERGSLILVG